MSKAKIAITIEQDLLREVDRWVQSGEYPSRSRALEASIERLRADRTRHRSLLAELAQLDPDEERRLADEWLPEEINWRKS